MGTRALVRRPGRRQHFATLLPGATAWIAVCNRDVPVFGATVTARDDWNGWIATAEQDGEGMCSQCRTPLLTAGLALREVEQVRTRLADVEALEVEVRTLRMQLADWTTAALGELRRPSRRAARR